MSGSDIIAEGAQLVIPYEMPDAKAPKYGGDKGGYVHDPATMADQLAKGDAINRRAREDE
jgi:hypothetical protein